MIINEVKKLKRGQIIYNSSFLTKKGNWSKWRVNGKPQTWKRNSDKIKVPLKHGLMVFGYLTEENMDQFRLDKIS